MDFKILADAKLKFCELSLERRLNMLAKYSGHPISSDLPEREQCKLLIRLIYGKKGNEILHLLRPGITID